MANAQYWYLYNCYKYVQLIINVIIVNNQQQHAFQEKY